jgi:hypothetical protein
MRSLRQTFPMLIVVLGATIAAAAGQTTATSGGAKAPLTVRASCDTPTQMMHVQIANTSDRPTAILVGFTAATGQTHVVNSVDVLAIRPATGADEDYVYVNPKFALANGAPWIVSLAPGATHDADLPLKDFISSLNYSPLDPSIAGGARVVFEGRPAAKQSTPVWTGKVQTVLAPCT